MLVVVVALCMIANVVKVRLDLTENKLFTLSQGTRDILQSLDTPVELRFYCSRVALRRLNFLSKTIHAMWMTF